MQQLTLLTAFLLAASASAPAALYSYTYSSGFANLGVIADGNASPWSDTHTLTELTGLTITGVNVRLNLSGGYNGDLYGYLSHNGVLLPLLNRVGVGNASAFGYADAGLNVKFTDGATDNIHFYQSIGGYSTTGEALWKPDGREINPITSLPADFEAGGTIDLSAFNGPNAGGDWTLAFADVSVGGGAPTVVSWGLDIEAVPEPANVALGIMAAGALLLQGGRAWQRHRRGPNAGPQPAGRAGR